MDVRALEPFDARGRFVAILGISLLGVYSSFWRLGAPSWKMDEEVYAVAGWHLVHTGVDLNSGHPPVAKLLFGWAQELLGRDLTSVRTVGALGALLAMVVLFRFGRHVADWSTGALAAGLFAVLPRSMEIAGWDVGTLRIDRYGLLESVAAPLLLTGLWFGWRWIHGGGVGWAAAAGLLFGLAGATKINAAVPFGAVVASVLIVRWGRRRLAAEAIASGVGVVVGFALPFAVFGSRAVEEMTKVLQAPLRRASYGHLVAFGDEAYELSPWWANLRYQLDADGPWLVAALVAGIGCALLSRHRLAVLYLVAAISSLLLSLMVAPVALPHYRAVWTAPLFLLVALGLREQAERVRGWQQRRTIAAPAVVAACSLVVLAAVGTTTMARLAVLGRDDYRQMVSDVRADGVDPKRIVVYAEAVSPYFPHAMGGLLTSESGEYAADLIVMDHALLWGVEPEQVERWRGWARSWGLEPHVSGRVEAWW